MRIFNKFVESKKEPSNKNDIWFDGSVFRIYKEEEWQAFTVNLNDANEIAKLKDELYEFLYDEAKPIVEEAKQAAATIQEYVDRAIDALVLAQQSLANSESAITEATALKSQTEHLIEQGNDVIENANKATDNANETSSNIKAIWDELFVEINNSIASANEAAINANTAAETIDSKIAEKIEPVLNLLNTIPFFNLSEDYTKIIKGEAVRTEEFVRDVSGHNYLIGYNDEMYYINDSLILVAIIPSTISYVDLETSRWYVSNSSFKYNEESNKYEPSGFYGFIPARLLLDGTDSFSDVLFPHSGGHNMILKTEQELTEEEKAQVKKNLDIKDAEPYDDTALKEAISKKADKDETDTKLTELSEEVEHQGIFIEDLQNMKIDRENDDYYPKMAVGLADNLAGVDVVDSEVNFRRSGGGAISDGVARIEAIKGNSVVWNQLCIRGVVKDGTSNGISYSVNANGVISLNGQTSDNYAFPDSGFVVNYIAGHKYILLGTETDVVKLQIFLKQDDVTTSMLGKGIFTCNNTITAPNMPRYRVERNSSVENFEGTPLLIDLTKMFGAGKEPTTIEEFYSRIPMGVDLNAYNEGEVIHMDVQSIESQGVNAWDEEWEVGKYSLSTGLPETNSIFIRCKNPIRVSPNTQYYIGTPSSSIWIAFLEYDAEGNFLRNRGGKIGNITTSTDCSYVRFYVANIYGTTYKNDICINISDTSINGKYFPYIKRTEDLSIIRKYFPNGMKSAGSAHDEIRYNKASGKWEKVVRIGEVDLGTLTFRSYRSVFISSVISGMNSKLNTKVGLLARYPYCSENNGSTMLDNAEDKVYCTNGGSVGGSGNLAISDSSYTDVASFKAAMSGVILYYELAEPIVTELDAEDQFKDLDYQVWNCGTEKAIAEGKSAPLAADITYGFNAIGKIKELESLVAALRAKVGI